MQCIYEDSCNTMNEKLIEIADKLTHVRKIQETYEDILQKITESSDLNLDKWSFHKKLREIVARDINWRVLINHSW